MNAVGGYVPTTARSAWGTRRSPTRQAQRALGPWPYLPVGYALSRVDGDRDPPGRHRGDQRTVLSTARAHPERPAAAVAEGRRWPSSSISSADALLDPHIGDLSTGTRRVVELAGLLARQARVLCLDEPTAGVAQRETEAFGPLILDVKKEFERVPPLDRARHAPDLRHQ